MSARRLLVVLVLPLCLLLMGAEDSGCSSSSGGGSRRPVASKAKCPKLKTAQKAANAASGDIIGVQKRVDVKGCKDGYRLRIQPSKKRDGSWPKSYWIAVSGKTYKACSQDSRYIRGRCS